ncbi:MAG: anaerobic C4-dicarboxylate transporter [Deferribacteraceae bacterium]|jgi:anaerobic C4-dicarboxylate transporter DcuA|nr:anaerobic C4-dicarboxylate transporter [Deferribacteraceae bacterium]
MDLFFWLQFAVVLVCIGIGGRFGGIGLGVAGGLGLGILTFGFGMKPDGAAPVTVMLIILAVITCVAVLQAAGGLDLLVSIAEKMLRKKPGAITFFGPAVVYLFTVLCGTSYVAFSVYPVIAEIATEARVRPERAMSMAVIASNFGVVASPMSAAISGMIAIVAGLGVTPLQILMVTIPGTFLGCLAGCIFVYKRGAELKDDAEFQRRVATGEFKDIVSEHKVEYKATNEAKLALVIFLAAIVAVVTLGSIPSLLPSWVAANGSVSTMSIPTALQIVMLMTASFIMIFCKVQPSKLDSGSVFKAGLVGVVAIFGLSWMMGTFFETYSALFKEAFLDMQNPFVFAVIIFVLSIVIYSPSATVAAIMPLGVLMGLPVTLLVGLMPATAGSFIIPGGAQIGCVAFDRTGSTRIGKYAINHSYLLPGMVAAVVSTVVCLLLAQVVI